METDFRCLRMDELLAAQGLITEVTDWLLKKGIDQWQMPFPLDLNRQRQEAGQNFRMFVVGGLLPAAPAPPRDAAGTRLAEGRSLAPLAAR